MLKTRLVICIDSVLTVGKCNFFFLNVFQSVTHLHSQRTTAFLVAANLCMK